MRDYGLLRIFMHQRRSGGLYGINARTVYSSLFFILK
jgi:hypothetical protein